MKNNRIFSRTVSAALAALLLVCALPLRALAATPTATSFSTSVPANRQSVIQLQGADADGTALTFATLSSPSHGALSNLNASTGSVIYTPTSGYTGADSFTYKVTSGGQDSSTATVTITVSNAKTTVTGTITDASGNPRAGKVTFILTQQVVTPAGLVPAGTSVSASLSSSGTFSTQLYPSRGMNPQAYYQVWFRDAATGNSEALGVYDIPLSATPVGFEAYKVTDTNLAVRYLFASVAGLEALIQAVANASIAQLVGESRTTGKLQKWDGTNLSDSIISESGAAATVAGSLTATGAISSGGAITATGAISAGGTITSGGAITSGSTISAPGVVTAGGGFAGITAANVPALDAAKTTTGTFSVSRIPDLPASKTTSGKFTDDRLPSLMTGKTLDGATLNTPTINNPTIAGTLSVANVTASGTVTAQAFVGDCSGCTGVGSGTGGVENTGSTTVGADAEPTPDGVGVIDLQTRNTTRLRVENDGFITEYGPLTGTNVCAVAGAVVGPGNTTLRVATAQAVAASCTVPSYVTLEFTGKGLITVASGQTFTVTGPLVAPPRQIFAGAGLVRFTGNTGIAEYFPEWLGAKVGDGVDDTAQIQALVNALSASEIDSTVRYMAGRYTIAGALQGTGEGGANAQLVLPARATMLSMRWKGAAPAPTFGKTPATTGTILESTLATGTGSVIGGVGPVFFGDTFLTDLSFHLEDLTVQTVANPTISGVDLTAVPNATVRNVQINASTSLASAPEQTTATSYGLKLAPVNVPDLGKLDNVMIMGFYTSLKAGELTKVDDLVIAFTRVGIEVPGAFQPYLFDRVWIGHYITAVKFTGGASYVDFQQLVIERNQNPAWAVPAVDIDDPNNYAHGEVNWHLVTSNVGVTSDLVQNGAFYLWTSGLGSDSATYNASPLVVAHHSAAQSIPYDTPTNVVFNTNISSDTMGLHSTTVNPDRFLCKKLGKAVFEFGGQFAVNATGVRQFRIYKHSAAGPGSDIQLALQNAAALPVVVTTLGGTATGLCTLPGDYFFVRVAHNAVDGSSNPTALNLESTNFSSPRVSFTITR